MEGGGAVNECIVEVNENPTIVVDGWTTRCDDWLIQREEIVRCRDCTYRRHEWHGKRPDYANHYLCAHFDGCQVNLDGFCAWGVRRNNG